MLKQFHFISNDQYFLDRVGNKAWTNVAVKQYRSQEKFMNFWKDQTKSTVFLDVDSQSNPEIEKSITQLQKITDRVIVVSKDIDFAYYAIKLGVHDYILKDKFTKETVKLISSNLALRDEGFISKVAIHCENGVYYVNPSDIIRCQAESNYTKIIMNEGSLLIAKTLSKVEDLFPSTGFCRTHRSHLVNLEHIKMVKYEGVIITSDKCAVPIARNQKKQFWIQMKSFGR